MDVDLVGIAEVVAVEVSGTSLGKVAEVECFPGITEAVGIRIGVDGVGEGGIDDGGEVAGRFAIAIFHGDVGDGGGIEGAVEDGDVIDGATKEAVGEVVRIDADVPLAAGGDGGDVCLCLGDDGGAVDVDDPVCSVIGDGDMMPDTIAEGVGIRAGGGIADAAIELEISFMIESVRRVAPTLSVTSRLMTMPLGLLGTLAPSTLIQLMMVISVALSKPAPISEM